MHENEIARLVVDAAYVVHSRLGPGLFESVYEAVLQYEIQRRGLAVERQVAIPITYDQLRIADAFRADLVIGKSVLVELKSLEQIGNVHKKQVLTYLRLANLRLGLLINFGEELIKHGITRIVNGLSDDEVIP